MSSVYSDQSVCLKMEIGVQNENFDQIFDSGDELEEEEIELEQMLNDRESILEAENINIVSSYFIEFL